LDELTKSVITVQTWIDHLDTGQMAQT